MTAPTISELAKMIDHSLLHPTMTAADLETGCRLAIAYEVATVCVKPYDIERAAELLHGSGVLVCSVVAFPHGNSHTDIKIAETRDSLDRGSVEIDMVVNIGQVLGGEWDLVSEEIRAVNEVVVEGGAILKVIFENDYLEDAHIIKLCEVCSDHDVAFVKTSSGYGFVKQPNGMYTYRGAVDHDLILMREHSKPGVQVKAAGGVRNLDDLLRVRALGVTRIGATATQVILDEARERGFPLN